MSEQNRPYSVQAFEWLSIASVIYDMVATDSESIFGDLLFWALWVGLIFWITRGRSNAARIIYTALSALTVAALFAAFRFGFVGTDASIPVIWTGVQMAGLLALLWWPSTSDWLKTKPRPAPTARADC